jgi:hypothetical protein
MPDLSSVQWNNEEFSAAHYMNGWCPVCGGWRTLSLNANRFGCQNCKKTGDFFPDGDSPEVWIE